MSIHIYPMAFPLIRKTKSNDRRHVKSNAAVDEADTSALAACAAWTFPSAPPEGWAISCAQAQYSFTWHRNKRYQILRISII